MTILVVLHALYGHGEQRVVPVDVSANTEFRYAIVFLERYKNLISGQQTESVGDSIRRVKEDGFKYIVGNDNVLRHLSGDEDIFISFSDGIYRAEWRKNGAVKAACTMPANIELLTLSNKIELENRLISRLNNLKGIASDIARPVFLKSDLKPVTLSDFFVDDKGFYITPRLRHQMIYSSVSNDKCELLVDTSRYQLESLANMMLSGFTMNPKLINLKISQYGYKTHPIELDFATLFNILATEGSIPYWGVDTFDGKTVTGLYLWLNQTGGFAHMLSVSVPINILSYSEKIQAELHCYLRLDNLKTMFEEYPEL